MVTLRNLIFWLTLPFLIPQALWVRATAPRFPPAAGGKAGTAGSGEEHVLLAIGDSIIAGVGANQLDNALVGQTAKAPARRLDSKVTWSAQGQSGANAAQVRKDLVDRLPNGRAQFIIVSVGVNDVTGLTRLEAWRRNLASLFAALNERYPDAVIALAGLPPLRGFPLLPQPLRFVIALRGREIDRVSRELLDGLPYAVHVPVDFEPHPEKFSPDGFHPSEASYAEFAAALADALVAVR